MTLSNRYLDHWPETRERFLRWWRREPTDRPLIRLTAPRDRPLDDRPAPPELPPPQKYLDAEYRIGRWRHDFDHTWFGADAFTAKTYEIGIGDAVRLPIRVIVTRSDTGHAVTGNVPATFSKANH